MDDEEIKAQEEEEERARKRRRKQAEEQEEAEEEWKAKRRSRRVEVDDEEEPSEENDDNNNDDKDKKNEEQEENQNEKDSNNENNNDEDNNSNSSENNNNNEENNNQPDSSQNNNSNSSENSNNQRRDNSSDRSDNSSRQGNRGNNNTRGNSSGNARPNTGGNTGANASGNAATNAGTNAGANAGANVGANAGASTASSTAASSAATSSAASGAAAGSAGGAAGAAGSGGLIAGLGSVFLIVLIIFIVLGILFFFITMPGFVVGKIGQALDNFLIGVQNFFDGDKAAERTVTREQIVKAAKYLDNMGYDLQGYGFLDEEGKSIISGKAESGFFTDLHTIFTDNGQDAIDPTNIDISEFEKTNYKERIEELQKNGEETEDIKKVYLSKKWEDVKDNEEEIKKSMLMIKDADGEIEFVRSKYLYMYLVASNCTYMVRNDNVDFAGRFLKLLGENPLAGENGVGLLYFTDTSEEDPNDYVSGLPNDTKFQQPESGIEIFGKTVFAFSNRYKVDKEKKQLIIYNSDDGWFKSTFYTYNLGGWVSQYGLPLQLSLALHLSTMAPDFAYEVATNAAANTKVEMGLLEIKGVTIRLILKLDFGDGPKDYVVDRDWAVHILNTGDDDDDQEENDYNSQSEADEAEGEVDEDEQNAEPEEEKTFDSELDKLEAEIIAKYNESGRILAGGLIYQYRNEGDADLSAYRSENSTMFDTSNNTKILHYAYEVNSSYIQALKNLVDKYDEKGNGRVRNIVNDYFKLKSADEMVYYTPRIWF